MSFTYKLIQQTKDYSIRKALQSALSDDGRLSYGEVRMVISSTFDHGQITYQEFNDLRNILKNAKTLDKRSENLIKAFLRHQHYHRYLQTRLKKKQFNLPYKVDHIPTTLSRRPGSKLTPLYLTIHSTANLKSTAKNERGWLTNPSNNRNASYHLVVDEKEAIECIPLDEVAWHAGSTKGNTTSIGLEICESGNRAKVFENASSLAAKLLRDKGWNTSHLRQHKDWSGKICPRILISNGHRADQKQTWDWFKSQVDSKL